jgi:transcriptional regulator with XRE-family HTH domain
MRLAEYLADRDLSDGAFAEMIGVEPQTVHRYKSGKRFPRQRVLSKILEVTNGAVTANDFAGTAPRQSTGARA